MLTFKNLEKICETWIKFLKKAVAKTEILLLNFEKIDCRNFKIKKN